MTAPYDIELTGYSPASNTGLAEVYDEKAVLNSMKMFIGSFKGDIIGRPGDGGYITSLLMKPMKAVDPIDIRNVIRMAFTSYFSPKIEIVDLKVDPDYQNRRWVMSMKYRIPSLKIAGTLSENLKGV